MQGSQALGARVGGICKRFFRFEICEVFFGAGREAFEILPHFCLGCGGIDIVEFIVFG